MIADHDRGFAWTNALLGLKAKEIHLCGDERALRLVSELMKHTQDEVSENSSVFLILKNSR